MSHKIMIIDDEASICELLTKLYKEAGYETAFSTDPLQAIEMIKNSRPDCVVMDIKMPKMDGIELLSQLKMIDKGLGVIMMTAYGDLETAMESMKLGAYDYVTKPFDLDFIKTLTAKCIEDIKKKG